MNRIAKTLVASGLFVVGCAVQGLRSDPLFDPAAPQTEYVPLDIGPQVTAVRPAPLLPPPPPPPPPTGPQLGVPLAGLTNAQLAAFNAGRAEFANIETPASGLGPIFNDVSCQACHNSGGPGGGGPINVTRFGKLTNGVFDPMEALGGSLLQNKAIDPRVRELVPVGATFVAQRQTTPLFGMGLIEAIPDASIKANATEQTTGVATATGISGRAAIITDVVSGTKRVGRFGWKAQQATLLAFSGDAYLNEMGITNRFFPKENAPNGNAALLAQFDHVIDIEDAVNPATGRSDIDATTDFMRLLAAPPQQTLTASASAGMAVFQDAECATCHKPQMFTGASPIAALNNKPVPLYSDLLLHYMGALGDHIAQGAAGLNEFKTPPLWGLRASAPYLHDGRAATVDTAIRLHSGEAQHSRDRYIALPADQRQQVLDFLNTL